MMNEIPIQEQVPEGEDLLLRLVEDKATSFCNVQARCSFLVSVSEMKKPGSYTSVRILRMANGMWWD